MEGNIERLKVCKIGTIFEEAKFGAKVAKAFITWTYFPAHLIVKLHLSHCKGVNQEIFLKGAWDLGPNVKLQHVLVFEKNVLLKALHNLLTKIAKVGHKFFAAWLRHFEQGGQDIIEGKIKINARLQCWMGFEQGDPKVDKKQFALPVAKWKGSMNTNEANENSNGRRC